jgi:hypothetical protein
MPRLVALAVNFLLVSAALDHAAGADVRRPRGLYVFGFVPQYYNAFGNFLNNPAVSGLAIRIRRKDLNPNPPSDAQPYDWGVFAKVAAWNAQNPSQAPGEFQFNVVVPLSTADGDQPIAATCNGSGTQNGMLLAVQH